MSLQMKARPVRAEKIFPLMSISDGIAISVNGTLTLGWVLDLPTAFSCTETEYDDIITSFASAIKILPPWTIIHKQDMFCREGWKPVQEETKEFLTQSYNKHFEGRQYLRHECHLFLSMSSKAMIEKGGNSSGLFGLGNAIKVPDQKSLDAFRNKAGEFISMLCASGFVSARQMTEADWVGQDDEIGIIQKTMMLGESSPVMSDILLAPDAVRVKDKTMNCYVIGESDVLPSEMPSVKKLERYSSESTNQVFLSMGAPLGVELDCEHVVNQYIVVPNQTEVFHKLESESKKMKSGMSSTDNRSNFKEVSEFLEDADSEGLMVVLSHTNIMYWGSEAELPEISSKVSTALASMNGIISVRDLYNTPILFYAGIPGSECDISKDNLMKMELFSSLCTGIYETFERSVRKGGVFTICDRLRNTPIILDTKFLAQELSWINNYNMFVIGGSGTGKSFFMNLYLRNLYASGEDIFLIDNGDSYEGLCSVINEETGGKDGHYMAWDPDHPTTFNPFVGFTHWLDGNGNLNMQENGVNFIISVLETLYEPERGWVSSNEPILKQTVCDFIKWANENGFSESNPPIMDDYYSYTGKVISPLITKKKYVVGDEFIGMEDFNLKDFRLSLKAYSKGGEFAAFLNEKNPKDLFDNRFSVMEISRLADIKDKKFYSIYILCMMNVFETKMQRKQSPKTLVVEEAWKAIANETMAPYLKSLWKTARKYSASCVVVTQELSDIISSETIRTAILDNSDIKVFLDQSNNRNLLASDENMGDKNIRTLLSLTKKEVDVLLSLNKANNPKYRYKEVFIKFINGHSGVFATEVSPEEALCYESNKSKKAPLLKLAKEKNSFIKAINAFVKIQNQSN